MKLEKQRIVLAVTAGIAAYKTPQLVRDLRKAGAEVRVILSKNAEKLVAPLALQAVSGHPVQSSLWEGDAGFAMDHIELAKWATMLLVAPASANVLAKLAIGIADDLLGTVVLATQAPLFIAPAMNQAMWSHPSTVSNVATLKGRGAVLLGPDSGEQACGDVGFGRMREPSDLVADLSEQIQATPELVGFSLDKHWFCGDKTLLITAGPTHEAWDPVRFLSNQSSGRMGFALAKAAQGLFARVILIAGPVELPTPTGVTRIDVVSAADMAQAVLEQIDAVDIFIAAAAVADFRPIAVLNQKIKKTGGSMFLELEPTEDIAQGIAARSNRPFVVGFAAETDEVIAHAKAKRARKKFDAIVANEVGKDRGFGDCEPTVHLINARSEVTLTAVSKEQLAPKLLACILDQWIQ